MIIVNISCIRCDALIIYPALTSDSTCLQVIPLSPQLFTQIPSIAVGIWSAVRSQRGSLALDDTNLDNSECLGIKVKSNVKTKQAMFEDALKHLWDLVAIPVKGKLDSMQGVSEIWVWWCPTSYLSSLPIHAAGIAAQDIHFCELYIILYCQPFCIDLCKEEQSLPASHEYRSSPQLRAANNCCYHYPPCWTARQINSSCMHGDCTNSGSYF